MKRYFICLLAILILSSLAFASGEKEAAKKEVPMVEPMDKSSDDVLLQKGLLAIPDKPTSIELITIFSGDGFKAMEKFLDEVLGKYYPKLKIEAQPTQSGELVQIINTRLAAGNPPPVLHASSSYFMKDWAEEGALLDLSDQWEKYGFEKIVSKGIADTMKFGGKYYGVPLAAGQNNILYWNKQVLQKYGVKEPPYASWDEFFAVEKQFSSKADIPFWAGGYSPAWFGFAKSIMLGASRFGLDYYARILNGKATEADFRNTLTFHKKIFEVANKDFISMHSVTGGVEMAGAGKAAMAMAGGWGHPRFVKNKLEFGKDWDMGHLPGTKTFAYTTTAYMAFKGSKNETVGKAIAITALLKEGQVMMAPFKGLVPGRTDIDPAIFPKIGRFEVAVYCNNFIQEATSIPRAVTGMPSAARSEFPAPISGYLAGSMSLDDAVSQCMAIQKKHQDSYKIQWDF